MRVIEYDKKYRQDFSDFNSEWIIDNFGHLEQEDYETFEYIEFEFIGESDGCSVFKRKLPE